MRNTVGHLVRGVASIPLLLLWTVASAQAADVVVEDVFIDHVSTVPANEGEAVQLFARRYHHDGADKGAVVFVSAGTLTAEASFGLDYQDYDYLSHLASLGFDVYAADLTGYGFSPRPMMDDPCNVDPETQEALLVGNVLDEPCAPSYAHPLTSNYSDWDEIDRIVDHVRDASGDDRVALVGWSRGGPRMGGYAAQHPDKVERLVLIEPVYPNPDAPNELPAELPEGFPLRLGVLSDFAPNRWRATEQCAGFADYDGVMTALKKRVNESDALGAQWGPEPGDLYRARAAFGGITGWNRDRVEAIRTPTLVIRGLASHNAENVGILFDHMTVEEKILVDFECGTHWVVWEATRNVVRDAIAEFLQEGTVGGETSGIVAVDRDGALE